MIKIDLNFFATLAEYLPENNDCYEVLEDTTVKKLVLDLGVPMDTVKLIFSCTICLNRCLNKDQVRGD